MKKRINVLLILVLSLLFASAQSPDYIFVFLNKKSDKSELPEEEVKKIMDGHMANINRLAAEGKLVAAGPFDGGGGIFIFKSNSKEQVREWISTDPGVQANRWNVEILNYFPKYGSVCQVTEPYQMVTYQFVRYTVRAEAKSKSRIVREHNDYLKSMQNSFSIVTHAMFSETEEILIVDGELTEAVINNDPAVRTGLLDAEIKTLWIARGSFCEK